MKQFTDRFTFNSYKVRCLLSLLLKEHDGFVLVSIDARPINQRVGDLFNVEATWKRLPLTIAGHRIYESIFQATKGGKP